MPGSSKANILMVDNQPGGLNGFDTATLIRKRRRSGGAVRL